MYNVLKHWVTNYYHDFAENSSLVYQLIAFIDNHVEAAGMQVAADQLRRLLKKKVPPPVMLRQANVAKILGEIKEQKIMVDQHKVPLPRLPKNISHLNLLDIDPLELARQLAIMEQQLYKAIQVRECLNQAWNKKGKGT